MRKNPKKVTRNHYHYTNAHGLMGIFEQRKIWATHINYLNDKKEFIDAMDRFRKQINDSTHMDNSPTKKYDGVLEILQILHGALYVTSFSEVPDQLSQWRGYCGNGPGFSIGFNRAKLQKLVKRKPNSWLKRCTYTREIKERKIEGIIKAAESKNLRNKDFFLHMYMKMMAIAPYFKDESFEEEKEWRLVLIEGRNALFRGGDTLIIPYVEFDLRDEDGNLPIDSIWIGPTINMEESLSSLKLLLEKHKIPASIEKSAIPYRPAL